MRDRKSTFASICLLFATLLVAMTSLFSRLIPNPSFLSAVNNALFLLLVFIIGSAFLSTGDRSQPANKLQKWFSIIVLISGFIPFISVQFFPGNNFAWFISHLGLAALVITAHRLNFEYIWMALGILNIGSLLTSFLGASAFSEDTRSLLFPFRLTGLLGHPNVTAFVAAITVVYGIHRNQMKSPILISAVVVLGATFSLTSVFCVITGLSILLLGRYRKIASSVSAFTMLVAASPIIGVLVLGLNLNPELFTNRSSIWTWLREYGSPPFGGFGLGFLNLQQVSGQVLWVHAHNQALMSFYTLGIAGLVSLTCLAIILLRLLTTSFSPITGACVAMLAIEATTEVPLFIDFPAGRWLATVFLLAIAFGHSIYSPVLRTRTRTVRSVKKISPRTDQFST